MLRKLIKNKIYIVILIAVCLLFPSAIGKASISNMNLLVVAMGIDKVEEEYETSLMVIVPKQSGSFNQSLEVISAKGETVRQSLNQLSLHTGKQIGLGHCGMIIFNDEAIKEDVVMVLDYLVRDTQIDNSCVLVNTNTSSKDLLEANKKLQNQYGVDTAKILGVLSNYVFLEQANIEEVINSKLSSNNVSFMSYITLSDSPEEGLDTGAQSGGQSQESSSGSGDTGGGSGSSSGDSGGNSSGGGQEKKVVSNLGEISLLLDGKKVAVADEEIMKGLYWLSSKPSKLEFMLSDFNDDEYKNAELSFLVKDKKQNKNYQFIDGKPKVTIDVSATLKLTEIVERYEPNDLFVSYRDYISDTMMEAIKQEIKDKINNSINFLADNKTDIISIYRGFEKYHYYEWQEYIDTLEDKKDFLKTIDFEINVDIKSRQ